jgi:hypothetical protein
VVPLSFLKKILKTSRSLLVEQVDSWVEPPICSDLDGWLFLIKIVNVSTKLTLNLLAATVYIIATSADQDHPICLCCLNMVCIVCYSVSAAIKFFPINDDWLCAD